MVSNSISIIRLLHETHPGIGYSERDLILGNKIDELIKTVNKLIIMENCRITQEDEKNVKRFSIGG